LPISLIAVASQKQSKAISFFVAQICTKSFVGWGFAPAPTGGAYSAPSDPLAGLGGGAPGEMEGGRGGGKRGRGGSPGMP